MPNTSRGRRAEKRKDTTPARGGATVPPPTDTKAMVIPPHILALAERLKQEPKGR